MAEIALYAKDKRLVTNAGALLPTNARPIVRWREQDTFTLRLADGGEFPEGAYHYAFDIDRDFLETEPCNTGECEIVGGALVFTATFDSVRQAQATNNRRYPVAFYMQVTRDGHDYAEYVVEDAIWVDGCVWDGRIPPAPEAPNYYTKAEVDEIAESKLDKPEEPGETGYVLGLAEDGSTAWIPQGGGSKQATDAEIDARESTTHAITPNNLDYAARSVLPNVTTIPAATTSYSLLDASATTNNHSWQYFHAPEAASTYTFPAVTNTAVAHRIKLTLDFTAVQTYSFEDASGNALTPLFTPTISTGDVYEFDCEYSAVKSQWLIWPHKQGAVSDDYVMQSQVGAANGVAGLDGNALVSDTELPKATNNDNYGVVRFAPTYGLKIENSRLTINQAAEKEINTRSTLHKPIIPSNLNYAVAAALTDANKIQLTDAQKASAQDTLGVGPAPLILSAAPTTSTVGVVGQLAVNTTTSKTYHCTAVTNTGTEAEPAWSYTWVDDINAKGGTFTGNVYLGQNIQFQTNTNGRTTTISGSIFKCGYNVNASVGDYGNILSGYRIYNWYTGSSLGRGGAAFGENLIVAGASQMFTGKFNQCVSAERCVGGGSDENNRYNIEELKWNGNHYIRGGHQQYIATIPPATTSYTLTEGVQRHMPDNASTYALPDIPMTIYTADYGVYVRNESLDGNGYYGWNWGTANRYTASATPAVGDNTYTNTALTQNAKPVTAIDNRTHECILTVRFSASVLTYAFEDAAGNTLTPLPLAGTIADGSVVAFRCTWEALLNQWVIMPVMLGGVAPSVQQTLTVSGTGAQSNSLDGTYTLTNDTNNSRPVWYNSTNQKYIFAVENGMDAGWYAWVVGGSVVQQSAGDTMMFYTYCTYDVQGLSNLSETPDQSTTAWYSMGSEVSSSEFSVTA